MRRPARWPPAPPMEVRHERGTAAAARGRRHDPARRHRQGRGRRPGRPRPRARREAAPAARRGRGAQGDAEQPQRRDRQAVKAGADPKLEPEVLRSARESTERRRLDRRARAGIADARGRARRSPPADPEPARSGHPDRWRGGQRHHPDLGRAPAGRGRRLDAQAALGARRGARHPRQRPGRQDRGLRLPGLQGRRVGPPARPDQLVPRRPHPRERHDRGLAAGRRQHRVGHRDRPDPRQGRPDVRRHPRRAVPGPDGRGPGHQPPSRRDPRGRPAADPLRGLHAVLPARGRRGRQGHPRASCASTSSTRSRWSCSSGPRTPRPRSNG